MRPVVRVQVGAVLLQLRIRQRDRPRSQLAGDAALMAVRPHAVLHRLDLQIVPVEYERREYPAMVGQLAIEVAETFPDAHGGQVRRTKRRDLPLVDRVVRYSGTADLAVRPLLPAGPFRSEERRVGK